MAALVTGNQATTSVIERGLNDADAEVRRFAAAAAATDARIDERERIIKIALADKEPRVRLEALRAWGRQLAEDVVRADPRRAEGCQPAREAAGDRSARQRLSRGRSARRRSRRRSSTRCRPTPRAWHAPAHALVSLARDQPDAARQGAAARSSQHPTWQVRMYAARAAGVLRRDRRSRRAWRRRERQRPRGGARGADRPEACPKRVPTALDCAGARRLSAGASPRRARSRTRATAPKATTPLLDGARPPDQGAQGHVARSAHGDPQSPAGVRRCVAGGRTSKAT